MTRELYWAGFGFQVWCQLLTHLCRAHDTQLVVVDEPEIYLHPDVQRQLIGILRDLGPDVLLATHSTEIMAEADPSEIVLIDKHKHSAERLKDVAGVQRAMDSVGSVQNITLTALARNRRVLFLEGDDDFRLLRRFVRWLGFDELAAGFGITSLESGGFGSWQRITTLADGIGQALGTPLMIGAVYDRDYFCRKRSLPSLKRSRGISDLLMCISAKRSRTTFLCPTRSIAPLPEQLPTALRALALPLATYQRQQGFYKKSQIP